MEPMGRGSEKYRSLLGRRPYARIASAIVFSVGVKREGGGRGGGRPFRKEKENRRERDGRGRE